MPLPFNGMPFGPGVDLWLPGHRRVHVRGESGPCGIRISVEGEDSGIDPVFLELDVERGICRLNHKPWAWPLWRGLPWVARRVLDPFDEVVRRAKWMLLDLEAGGLSAEGKSSLRIIHALTRQMAMHAADRCNPEARKSALRFGTTLRWFVYRLLVADPTGRMAQMAQVAPGVLVTAAAFERFGGCDDAALDVLEHLVDRVVQGDSPKQAADWLTSRWLPHCPATELSDDEAFDTQSLLVRRASALAAPGYLWHRPPYAFAPEDIPTGPRKNAWWLVLIKALTHHGDGVGLDLDQLRGLSSFVSKSGLELHARMGRPELARLSRLLVHYVVLTQQTLGRKSSVNRVAKQLVRYRGEILRAARLARVRQGVSASCGSVVGSRVTEATLLSPSPVPSLAREDLSVESIGTIGELIQEGLAMRNCVPSFADAALRGDRYFYRVVANEERLTVMVEPCPEGGYRREVKAKANRQPSAEAEAKVAAWLRAAMVGTQTSADEADSETDDIPF